MKRIDKKIMIGVKNMATETIWLAAYDHENEQVTFFSVKNSWLRNVMKSWAEEDARKGNVDNPKLYIKGRTENLLDAIIHNELEEEIYSNILEQAKEQNAIVEYGTFLVELFEGRYGKQAKVRTTFMDYVYLFPKGEKESDGEYIARVSNEFQSEDEEYGSYFELVEQEQGLGLFED